MATEEALLAEIAETLPMSREVTGEKQHQQNLDQFHGLKRSQIHLGVVSGGAAAERNKRAKQSHGAQQRRVTPVGEAPIVEPAEGGQHQKQTAEEHSGGEFLELQRVAQRVAHADHEKESEARQ